jgi:hypothetical protein
MTNAAPTRIPHPLIIFYLISVECSVLRRSPSLRKHKDSEPTSVLSLTAKLSLFLRPSLLLDGEQRWWWSEMKDVGG